MATPTPTSKKRRLRKLCDIEEEKEKEGEVTVEEILALNNDDDEKTAALALTSRLQGFERDFRFVTGDLRDPEHLGHHLPVLKFEVIRRSIGTTWETAKMEWRAKETVGVFGWESPGLQLVPRSSLNLSGSMLQPREPCVEQKSALDSSFSSIPVGGAIPVMSNIWVDNLWVKGPKRNHDFELGQCACLLGRLKKRYRIVNIWTDEELTVGSKCIEIWGEPIASRAYYTEKEAYHVPRYDAVIGKKWCR